MPCTGILFEDAEINREGASYWQRCQSLRLFRCEMLGVDITATGFDGVRAEFGSGHSGSINMVRWAVAIGGLMILVQSPSVIELN